jgi:hypothetical protein
MLAVSPAATAVSCSGGAASAGTRSLATRSAATPPKAAHAANTTATPPAQISTPVSEPAIAIPAASTQLTTTLAAVSWSGVTVSDGISVDCAGRVAVTAVEATTAAPYAANGKPPAMATAVAAIAAACTR